MASIFCENCGKELDSTSKFCISCGAATNIVISETPATEIPAEGATENHATSPKEIISGVTMPKVDKNDILTTLKKKPVIIAIALVILISAIFVIQGSGLSGDDKIAYDLLAGVVTQFKDPSSVVLTGGTLGVDKDWLFCGISATNSYGSRATNYYAIHGDYGIVEMDDVTSIYKNTENLDIAAINKQLQKEFGL